jgi:hypothetical protein
MKNQHRSLGVVRFNAPAFNLFVAFQSDGCVGTIVFSGLGLSTPNASVFILSNEESLPGFFVFSTSLRVKWVNLYACISAIMLAKTNKVKVIHSVRLICFGLIVIVFKVEYSKLKFPYIIVGCFVLVERVDNITSPHTIILNLFLKITLFFDINYILSKGKCCFFIVYICM